MSPAARRSMCLHDDAVDLVLIRFGSRHFQIIGKAVGTAHDVFSAETVLHSMLMHATRVG